MDMIYILTLYCTVLIIRSLINLYSIHVVSFPHARSRSVILHHIRFPIIYYMSDYDVYKEHCIVLKLFYLVVPCVVIVGS